VKRALPVLDEEADLLDRAPAPTFVVRLGDAIVRVGDTGDGEAAWRFATFLVDAGGTRLDSSAADATMAVVIRSASESAQTHARADALEREADFVLGSARAAFAERLASALRR
jgi:hypothetical protein